MLRDERQSKQKQFRIDLCKSLDMQNGGGGKEGEKEKWGKVGEKGRRKKGRGGRVHTEYLPYVLVL